MDPLDLGWIGTGVMGGAMCGHLLSAGHRLTVFNRSPARAQPLLARGARWAERPSAVAARSQVTFTMVGLPSDVREVVLGTDGALAGARKGSVLVDLTTSEPSLAREIEAAARSRGVASLDAPVSGGDVGAREGRLSILVGGDASVFDRVLPLLRNFGATIVHHGPAGSGQHAKTANQILIAAGIVGVSEALVYAKKAGLDLEAVLRSVAGGAAGSWALSNYAPRMLRGDFAPGFLVDHFVKDLGIAVGEAERMSLSLPGLDLARDLYRNLQAAGQGRRGIHALVLAVGKTAALDWPDSGAR